MASTDETLWPPAKLAVIERARWPVPATTLFKCPAFATASDAINTAAIAG
jgi:hypothetical protein